MESPTEPGWHKSKQPRPTRSPNADVTKTGFERSTYGVSPFGLQKYVYAFKVDGDKITGRASFERENGKGEVDLQEIKLTGEDISFMEPLEFDGQQIRIDYHGKVAGDEMKLTRQVGDFATEEVVAKRVREEPAKPSAPKP